MILWLVLACTDKPTAIVAGEGFFDRPFPSDARTIAGRPDMSGFPAAGTDLGASMVEGWARQCGEACGGFSHLGPIYLRFDGALDVAPSYPGEEGDPIRLYSLDSGDRAPIRARFVEDPQGDPMLVSNLLIVQPEPWHPLRSGERYALVVDRSLAHPADGWQAPDGIRRAATATVFTVQDSLGELRALGAATDAALDADPSLLQPTALRRVSSIAYRQGKTPSGRDATVFTVTYDDGTSEVSHLAPFPEDGDFTVDLSSGAMEVWEAYIQTVAFQQLADQPYASPGIGFLSDFDRSDGWIDLGREPTPEPMRVVIQLPSGKSDNAVTTWDHGTGGHAYNAVQRHADVEDFSKIRGAFAEAGVAVVSRDQPLYGTRYPLIDEGFGASLGFYNLGNLPAFRDNQRQAAVDHRVLHRFVTEALPGLFPGRVDPERTAAFGHSLGSVTLHLGLALQGGDGAARALPSGTGGFFTYYVLDTGLLGSGNDLVALLGPLLGVELPEDPTGGQAIGALIGAPEEAWEGVDAGHPVFLLFQTLMDPSDPMVFAPEQAQPEHIVMGIGDWQVPNGTTEWLLRATPGATKEDCTPRGDYDPHHCIFREPEGLAAFEAFAAATSGR